MSNVNGSLVCHDDGTGTVTAQVSGTGVARHATVDLNGQGQRELGPGDHSYTLSGTFADGETVRLIVHRDGGDVQIKVLTVDCPVVTTTTEVPVTTTTPPIVTPPPEPRINTQVVVPSTQPTLPATGSDGALVGLAFLFVAAGAALVALTRKAKLGGD